MIEEKDIQALCGDRSVFKRGRGVYLDGMVKNIRYERKGQEGLEHIKITAKVQGSGINLYQVVADIVEGHSAVEKITCTCPAFYSYDGICKHCVGTLLQYLANRNSRKLETQSSASRGIMPARSSSQGMTELINHYKTKERRTYQQAGLNGTVNLYPLMSTSYEEMYVEFKIGFQKKKYVMKNIRTFVEAMEQERYEYYGKELEFYHTLEAFSPESRPMAEFLITEINNPSRQARYWYYDKGNRYLNITGGNMDAFYKALGQQPLSVKMDYGDTESWRVSDEAYRPSLTIEGQGDGILLETDKVLCDYGRDFAYVWEKGVIYRMPIEDVYDIRPVWEYISKNRQGSIFVSKVELPAFCQELLPVLERHYAVKKRQFQEQAYLPPEPEYEIYLDAPDRQTVSCEMYVFYDRKKYNILDRPRAAENRNELEELKHKEQVGRWFQEKDIARKRMLLSGDEERIYDFLTEGMEELSALGTIFISDALKAIQVRPSPSVSVGVSLKGEMLELTLDSEDMPLAELAEILSSYQRKRKFFRLKNGEFLNMDEDGLGILSKIQDSMAISPKQWAKGTIQLPKYRALYLDGELREKNGFHTAKNRSFRALVRNMKTVEDNDFEIPESLGKVLREYQKQGFLWLKTLNANGFGGILADDMGLGKTLQVIAFLLSEWEQRETAQEMEQAEIWPSSRPQGAVLEAGEQEMTGRSQGTMQKEMQAGELEMPGRSQRDVQQEMQERSQSAGQQKIQAEEQESEKKGQRGVQQKMQARELEMLARSQSAGLLEKVRKAEEKKGETAKHLCVAAESVQMKMQQNIRPMQMRQNIRSMEPRQNTASMEPRQNTASMEPRQNIRPMEPRQNTSPMEMQQNTGSMKLHQTAGQREGFQEDGAKFTHFALIICPASLVYNWKSEIERFAPDLQAVAVAGTAAERRKVLQEAGRWDILITSYDLLRRDEEAYGKMCFQYEIIDEAQYIKNHNTKASKAVKGICAGFKAALTGTPIENRLSELWSIFDYLMPGFLYPYSRFREELELPIVSNQEEEASERLRKMIRPFVLRRLKKDVLKDLPAKMEEAVVAQMEGEQKKLYAAHVQRMKMMLDGQTEAEFATQKLQILAELTRLRQLCCDPGLIYEDFKGEPAKLLMCVDLIKNAIDGGHKVLLFSQFTTMLERIEDRLHQEDIPYFCLTGATSKERRAELVQRFQDGEVPVFCISLKAGGTGLNLTAADIVIHYDPWWNVAVQNQATDRAHRIGQKNVVTVYKLIAKGTIEENILKLQEKKKELAEQLLGNDGFEGVKITKEEMLKLLEGV